MPDLSSLIFFIRSAFYFLLLVLSCSAIADYEVNSDSLPFEPLSPNELRSGSEKKVFAHYFTQFPVSIDNRTKETDYYTRGYLSPNGESNKHLSYGGFLRDRPEYRAPRQESNWQELDFRGEIKTASSMGIDGFAWNILSVNPSSYHWQRGITLLEQAALLDNGFKILIMPDMLAIYRGVSDAETIQRLADQIELLAQYPAAFRLEDNRLAVSPYYTENRDADFWLAFKEEMKRRGEEIALIALFQGWESDVRAYEDQDILHGVSDWGWRDPEGNARHWYDDAETAHSKGLMWMMPVAPQDHRPKSSVYTEAGNFDLFRTTWDIAISSGADWVQLITWNDYSEHTQIAPSDRNGTVYVDLGAYYTQWFKTNEQPVITRDVLYYSHRIHHSEADYREYQSESFELRGSTSTRNEIELLGFLAGPGSLEIWIGDKLLAREAVSGGIHSIKAPLETGVPRFVLKRGDNEVINLLSEHEIVERPDYQDFHYRSGSAASPVTLLPEVAPPSPPSQLTVRALSR